MTSKRLKFFSTLSLIVALWASPIAAQELGYYLEEENTTPAIFGMRGGPSLTRIWITPDKLCREEGSKRQTTIIRSDLEKIWLIDHSDTTYTELSHDMVQGLAMMGLMMFGVTADSLTGAPVVPDPLFTKTGQMKMIDSWSCEEFVVAKAAEGSIGNMIERVGLWISLNTEVPPDFYSQMMRRLMGELGSEYDDLFRQIEALQGYPVLIETRAMGHTVTQTLKHVDQREIPQYKFELPKGYKEKAGLF